MLQMVPPSVSPVAFWVYPALKCDEGIEATSDVPAGGVKKV